MYYIGKGALVNYYGTPFVHKNQQELFQGPALACLVTENKVLHVIFQQIVLHNNKHQSLTNSSKIQ